MNKFFCKCDSPNGKNLIYKVIEAESQIDARIKFENDVDDLRQKSNTETHFKIEVYKLSE